MYKISARCNLMLSGRLKLWCKQGGAVWQVNLFRVDLQVSYPMQVGWHRWAQFGTRKWRQTGIETTAKPMRTKTLNRKSSENHMTFWYIIWQFMHCSCYFASIFLHFLCHREFIDPVDLQEYVGSKQGAWQEIVRWYITHVDLRVVHSPVLVIHVVAPKLFSPVLLDFMWLLQSCLYKLQVFSLYLCLQQEFSWSKSLWKCCYPCNADMWGVLLPWCLAVCSSLSHRHCF